MGFGGVWFGVFLVCFCLGLFWVCFCFVFFWFWVCFCFVFFFFGFIFVLGLGFFLVWWFWFGCLRFVGFFLGHFFYVCLFWFLFGFGLWFDSLFFFCCVLCCFLGGQTSDVLQMLEVSFFPVFPLCVAILGGNPRTGRVCFALFILLSTSPEASNCYSVPQWAKPISRAFFGALVFLLKKTKS